MGKRKPRRTEQAQKSTLDRRIRAEVDRAGSNAAGPHRLATTYTRKTKHKKEWA